MILSLVYLPGIRALLIKVLLCLLPQISQLFVILLQRVTVEAIFDRFLVRLLVCRVDSSCLDTPVVNYSYAIFWGGVARIIFFFPFCLSYCACAIFSGLQTEGLIPSCIAVTGHDVYIDSMRNTSTWSISLTVSSQDPLYQRSISDAQPRVYIHVKITFRSQNELFQANLLRTKSSSPIPVGPPPPAPFDPSILSHY